MSFRSFLPIFLLIFNFGFAQQESDSLSFPKIKSAIVMPIRLPLSELSATANSSVPNLIYQDDSYTDNNNDQFKVKVWKNGNIRLIGGKNQNLIIEVPVKIWAEKGIGTFGVYTYQNTTFETTMYFNCQLGFNANWSVKTKTESAGFKWVTKPSLDFGKIKIPITPFIEKSLKEQQSTFGTMIDKEMASKLNLKPYISSALKLFSEPINISDEYNTWLKITPIQANITPFAFYSNAIDVNLGIDVICETFTGFKPQSNTTNLSVPNLNFVSVLPKDFNLQTTANIPYFKATEIARETFLHKEFDFREGKSKIKIDDIKVYKDEEKIMLEIQTQGSVTGTSFISGTPVYDVSKHKIVLTETKFRLKTKNVLQKTASLLFKGKIIKMIEEDYGIPTQEIEDVSKKSIEETFNKIYAGNIQVSGKVTRLQPSKILLTQNGITAIINTNAYLQILLKTSNSN